MDTRLCFRLAALALGALLGLPAPARTQDAFPPAPRMAVSIDYVSGDGLYLAVGSDQGVALGDTLAVFADSTALDAIGRLVLTSVARRRSVARALDAPRALEAGTVVFVPVFAPPTSAAAPTDSATPTAATPGPRAPSPGRRVEGRGQLTGRLALDLDARETRTTWTGDLFGETVRRFATPTTRLSLTATGLPGGFSLRANLRGSYRYDELTGGPPPVSVRAYDLVLVHTSNAVPVTFMLGRFANPYESYSAYWDGALVRLGRGLGPGVGVVAGYEPRLHDEGFSTAVPKLTGFASYAARGAAWRYATDVSVHLVQPGAAPLASAAGWSQRLSVGPVDVDQRLRLDGGIDGRPWSVGDVRLRLGLDLPGPLRGRGAYGRAHAAWGATATLAPDTTEAAPAREEASVGLELDGSRASLAVDAGRTRREGSNRGVSFSGRARMRLGGGGLSLSGQRWAWSGSETLALAPSLDMGVGSMTWRVGYRFYRTDSEQRALASHAASAEVGLTLAALFHVTLGGERQWGENLAGTRLRMGVWRSF